MVQCWIHLIKINIFIWMHPSHNSTQATHPRLATNSSDFGSSVSAVESSYIKNYNCICHFKTFSAIEFGSKGWGQLCGEYIFLLALSSILVDKYWISMLVNKGEQIILIYQSNQYSKGIEYFIEYMKFQLFFRLGLLSQHTFSYFLDSFQT